MSAQETIELSRSAAKHKSMPLAQCVQEAISTYLKNLDGHKPINLYQMVLEEIEGSLLTTVLDYTKHNQCKTAAILGISRGTLRKMLKQYKL